MTDHEKKRYEDYKLACAALMLCYPFELDDIDGEIWRDIKGFEGHYQISNYGRVKSFYKSKVKILKPYVAPNGYLLISLQNGNKDKKLTVHRLVAETFIPNPYNLPEVDHKFGNKFDNYVENLEWVSSAENVSRAIELGLIKAKAEDNPSAKISNEVAKYCRSVYICRDKEFGASALAKKFGISRESMWRIVTGKSYKSVE